MKPSVYSERRNFPRANFLCKVILHSDRREFLTHTQNISAGGVRVLLFESLQVKSEVELVIFASRRLQAAGRVIWSLEVNEKAGEPLFDIGVEFTSLEESDREFLERLVQELLSKENGAGSA